MRKETRLIRELPAAAVTEPGRLRGGRMAKTAWGVVSFAPVFVAGGVALFAGTAHSAEQCPEPFGGPEGTEMCSIGTLSEFEEIGSSYGYGISSDGSVVTGSTSSAIGEAAYIWSENSGFEILPGTEEGFGASFTPNGISADGKVVVGFQPFFGAARWSAAASSTELLPGPSGWTMSRSRAFAANEAGDVVVGFAENEQLQTRATRWWLSGEEWQIDDIGVLVGATASTATGVNRYGNVVVGFSSRPKLGEEAFIWRQGDLAPTGLGYLVAEAEYRESRAYAVSSDYSTRGPVVVGFATSSDSLTSAVRWVNGTIELLGSGRLDAVSPAVAYDVSDDGTIVVGEARTADGERAFRWTEGGELVSLGTLTEAGSSRASGVSADGSIVVGTSTYIDGNVFKSRAFIWRNGEIQDYTNLMASFAVLADDTDLAVSTQQWSLGKMLDQTAFVGVEDRNYFAASAGASNAGSGALSDSQSNQVAGLTFGRGISAELTVGASLQMSGASNAASGFDTDTGTSVSIFAEYSKGGTDRTGLQASLALGYATAGNTITRGQRITDVEAATGNGDLETMAARVAIGYGIDHASGWLLTPHAAISQYSTSRGAYAEDPTATAFSAAYDELNVKTTVGTAGIVAGQKLNDASSFSLGAGVDFDINDDDTVLAGSANIPGMEEFGVTSALVRNDVRPYVTADYSIDVASGGTVTASARLEKALYGNDAEVGIGVRYGINF